MSKFQSSGWAFPPHKLCESESVLSFFFPLMDTDPSFQNCTRRMQDTTYYS
uniref:Uncharacterized protein n=1 Tax=Oryza brachyantha TaxID=4533 RepID=J3LGF1_ORYBR